MQYRCYFFSLSIKNEGDVKKFDIVSFGRKANSIVAIVDAQTQNPSCLPYSIIDPFERLNAWGDSDALIE